MKISSITDVVERQLCTGCGVCAYIEPQRFRIGASLDYGNRPFVRHNAEPENREALSVCPGIRLEHPKSARTMSGLKSEMFDAWGPVYEVWEGHSVDEEIRFLGSSGGAATALSLFCIERQGMSGVLHSVADTSEPYLSKTVVSRTRAELLAATGSRYSPASPCEGFGMVEAGEGKYVFVGKPCDVAATQSARRIRPQLDQKLELTIAFFCAGTPSLKGNLALLKMKGIENQDSISELRYRGKGWPGRWSARYRSSDGDDKVVSLSYEESWDFLQKYRQWRCYICPDHTGEFADIAVGDPWFRETRQDEIGSSLIVARTKLGLETILAAEKAGYLKLLQNDPSLLGRSQPNLLNTRGALWARLLILRLFGIPTPKFVGFSLFTQWFSKLTLIQKIRSIAGTAKRVMTKRLWAAVKVCEWRGKRSE